MLKKRLAGLASLALVGTFAFAMPGHANNGVDSRNYGTSSADCNEGTVEASPSVVWPPNHKMKTITVSYYEGDKAEPGDSDGDTISLSDFSMTQVDTGYAVNEEGKGSGQPGNVAQHGSQGPDFTFPANGDATTTNGQPWAGTKPVPDTEVWSTDQVQIRSERAGSSGPDGGRVYAITVTCHDRGGTDLLETQDDTATVFVCVPHDQSADTRGAGCPAVVPDYTPPS